MNPVNASGDEPSQQLAAETLKAVAALMSKTGGAYYIPLRSNSMLPLLRNGDQVLMTSRCDDIHAGEIVVFQRDREWMAHRVLRVEGDGAGDLRLTTKGDHVMRLDTPPNPDSLVGKVLAVCHGERQMRLDTRAWRVPGKLLANLMLVEAWLYGKLAGEAGSNRESSWWIQVFSRGMYLFNSLLLRSVQILFGRWERLSI